MASLSNINGILDVHSTGAILFSTSHGTSGQILKSNGNAAPTWIPQSDIVGAYLPLAGGTLTGATATASGISFTVGGTLSVGGNNVVGFSGGWNGANMPGSRWNGYAVNGGEVVFQRDNPSSARMSMLVDGQYYAGENGGFYSLYSGNDYNNRKGFYADSSGILQFNAPATFSGLVSGITPTAAANFATKAYVDAHPGSGGTVTSVATGNGLTGGTITSTGTLTMASSYTGGFTFNTSVASPIHSGTVSTSGDGQNNYPFRLGSDYSAYMVAAASNTWGLFWAGNSGARYGTNGNGGPGNIWSNSTNPNEFCFVGGDSTRWSVQGSTGDTWQLGNIYLSGTFVRANNNLTLQVDGGGTPVNAITIDNVGSTTFSGYTYFPNYLFHAGDTNTRIQFSTSTITLRGDSLILLDGPVTANEDVSIGGDIYQYGSIFRNSSFIDIVGNRNTKIELETAYFTHTVSNQAVNIQFPNVAQQGYYKITLSGSYSNQDISGKLTKVIPFGYNPNGSIWRTGNAQSEITIATGGVSTNFTIGNLAWDSTNSKFIVPIYKLTSSGNSVRILIEYFGAAANNLKDVNLSSNYTQTAPSPFNVRQYQNIRDRLGIGTTSPSTQLHIDQASNDRAGGLYIERNGSSYGLSAFVNSGGYGVIGSNGSFTTDILTMNLNNGNVGIGTTAPATKLHVENAAAAIVYVKSTVNNQNASIFFNTNSGGTQADRWEIGTNISAGSDLEFFDRLNSVSRMVIQNNGDVGIGTISPQQKLHINGNVRVGTDTGFIDFARPGGAIVGGIGWHTDDYFYVAGHPTAGTGAGNSVRVYAFGSLLSLGNPTAGDVLTVDVNGRVGIGTTAPSCGTIGGTPLLHAYNNTNGAKPTIHVSCHDYDEAAILLSENSSGGGNWGARLYYEGSGDNFFNIQTVDSGSVRNPAFSINRYGRTALGFNTANPAPQSLVQIGANFNQNLIFTNRINASPFSLRSDGSSIFQTNTGANAAGIMLMGNNGQGWNAIEFYHKNTSVSQAYVGRISTNSSSTSYVTSSDYRLKENVIPMSDSISRINRLKPSRFNFIINPEITVDGFLAHEVQDIVPEAIVGDKDEIDEEGNPVYQGIDQAKLVPLLVAAIQELEARVKELENK